MVLAQNVAAFQLALKQTHFSKLLVRLPRFEPEYDYQASSGIDCT